MRACRLLLLLVQLLGPLQSALGASLFAGSADVSTMDDAAWSRAERADERASWLVFFHNVDGTGVDGDDRPLRTAAANFRDAASKLSGNVLFGAVDCSGQRTMRPRLAELCGEIEKDRVARRAKKAESGKKAKGKQADEWNAPGAAVVAIKPKLASASASEAADGKKVTVGRYRGAALSKDLAQYANDKLLSDKLVSTLGPSDVAKGSSIYHHVKVTDFVASKVRPSAEPPTRILAPAATAPPPPPSPPSPSQLLLESQGHHERAESPLLRDKGEPWQGRSRVLGRRWEDWWAVVAGGPRAHKLSLQPLRRRSQPGPVPRCLLPAAIHPSRSFAIDRSSPRLS